MVIMTSSFPYTPSLPDEWFPIIPDPLDEIPDPEDEEDERIMILEYSKNQEYVRILTK